MNKILKNIFLSFFVYYFWLKIIVSVVFNHPFFFNFTLVFSYLMKYFLSCQTILCTLDVNEFRIV